MIWAWKDLMYYQVRIRDPDITAIFYNLKKQSRKIMLVSVYIPYIKMQ